MSSANKKKPTVVEESSDDEDFEVFCEICKQGFPGNRAFKAHKKQHDKSEVKNFMKEKYGKKYLEELEKMKTPCYSDSEFYVLTSENSGINLINSSGAKNGDIQANAEIAEDVEVLKCDICQKLCTGRIPYQLHLAGNAHAKKERQLKITQKLMAKNTGEVGAEQDEVQALSDIAQQLKPFANCEHCNKSFSGPEGYQQHLSSKSHRKMLINKSLANNLEKSGIPVNANYQKDEESSVFANCKECEKEFSGPLPYQQHMNSKAHKKRSKQIELNAKMQHLMVAKEDEEGSISCAECGETFYRIENLRQHLLGPAHAKLKQKEDLMTKLVTKHPEMVVPSKTSNPGIVDDGDSDDDKPYLVCKVCMKAFSGPESARDHFLSKNHLKTKKLKIKIEKEKTK